MTSHNNEEAIPADRPRSQGTSASASPPAQLASPSSPVPSQRAFQRYSLQNHAGTASVAPATEALRSNRFSMSFPVQPSRTSSPTRPSRSPVREAASTSSDSLDTLPAPTDTTFLTAIATQERRVLELKEELGRAEAELNKLKKHWAQHEAHKKREDAKKVTRMQPLQTALPTTGAAAAEEDTDGSNAWMQQEMERRKALLSSNQSSNRTVFTGSRHMRTLSLLSPVNNRHEGASLNALASGRQSRRDGDDQGDAARKVDNKAPPSKPIQTSRVKTTSDMMVDGTEATLSEGDKDLLLKTGKRMATDLRDGLWTFWEDLKQVTVGEEGTKIEPPSGRAGSNATPRASKKQPSRSPRRSPARDSTKPNKTFTDAERPVSKHMQTTLTSTTQNPVLASPSFWSDYGVPLGQELTPVRVKKVDRRARHAKSGSKISTTSNDHEGWDAWDENSPQSHLSRTSSAASEADTLPSTISDAATSPRTSTEVPPTPAQKGLFESSSGVGDSSKKEPIPWPALANLGPKALTRTASHLMAEWERSLTPSPTKEDGAGHEDYLSLRSDPAERVDE
ncbi:hypothetical protein BDY17DRAFT_297761 [Neohortaea acidophila]|uniref:DUF4048 domain-containing protein n=1 Tax=Neohortaea acidophila TaxID=245834 RepID=A0A6A6PWG2_9PEZI|nr:uncharacterized protein BDY17DRAFT_297761 [Neohortaea acidophila]KAF2483637.1 hypothetical protein BDY17DRAFT_297761 [Neohortaea acidophila]